ncbi:transposase [Salinicoccus sp. CNSTN-B1]
MARHRSFKEKMAIIEHYLTHGDMKTTSRRFEVSKTTIHRWVLTHQEKGPESLAVRRRHHTYSTDFKERVILEYLEQGIGYLPLARKYDIASDTTVKQWVIEYTEGKRLKSTFGGARSMTKSRKPTYEERLEIAQYHATHDVSIRELSERFDVSYQQAYQYVKKYERAGQMASKTDGAALNRKQR